MIDETVEVVHQVRPQANLRRHAESTVAPMARVGILVCIATCTTCLTATVPFIIDQQHGPSKKAKSIILIAVDDANVEHGTMLAQVVQ